GADERAVGFDLIRAGALANERAPELPALPGALTDLLVAVGDSVSYGWSVLGGNNAVQDAAALYGARGMPIPDRDPMVLTLSTPTGASVHHSRLPSRLAPGAEFVTTRVFVVGDGDVGAVRQELTRVRGEETGVLFGEVLSDPGGTPFAGAELVVLDADQRPFSHLRADKDGRFRTLLPPGSYFIRALGVGAPATPVELSLRSGIEIIAGESVYRRIALAAPAQVVVRASDPAGRQLPVKVSVVGEYDSIGRSEAVEDLINELALGDTRRPTDLGETLPLVSRTRRYLEGVAWGGGDPVRVAVRPTDCASVSTCETGARIGDYRIVVSRGPEYEIVELEDVSLSPGEVRTFDVILEKTVDTEGYLAVDFDVKSEASPGGQWTPTQRARVAAAEGLEAYFAADANQIVSAEGEPSAAGIQQWIRAFDAVELTTLERGENLILPLTVDNSRSNGLPSAGGCIAGSGADTLGAVLGGFECTMSQLWSRTRTLGSRGASFALVFASHPRRGIRGQLNQFSVSGNGEPTTPTALNDIWLGWPLSSTYRDGVLNPLQVELREYDGLMVWH
ncbi:MAG: hypothetical protein AAFY60_11605, partial [Myxococcota bacterium]